MSNFNDIEDHNLRAFNRLNVMNNLVEEEGPVVAQRYTSQFSQADVDDMVRVAVAINHLGRKKVIEAITKDMVFPDYLTEEEEIDLADVEIPPLN